MNNKKTFWEKIFKFPSFNIRFWTTVVVGTLILVIFGISMIRRLDMAEDLNLLFGFLNFLTQIGILVFAIFSIWLVFKQLIENRFERLEQDGRSHIKTRNYISAINRLKEASYIKPDSNTTLELLEAYLLIKDFHNFDETINSIQMMGIFQKTLLDPENQIIFYYLRTIRYLIAENIGEAKNHIEEIITVLKANFKNGLRALWDFNDLRNSDSYHQLVGDSKQILDNLLGYLENSLNQNQKEQFESGNFLINRLEIQPSKLPNQKVKN